MEDLKPSADLTDQTFNNLESLLDSIRKELYQVTFLLYDSMVVSQWPIKSQHKLFSPQKVHVRMHESLMYETYF